MSTTASSNFVWGTGRRKSALARVRVRPGTGTILVNDRELKEYFPNLEWQNTAVQPLVVLGKREAFDVFVSAKGGGLTGQSGAVAMGLARALAKIDHDANYKPLRQAGQVTRDSRMKERKKYGRAGARRAFQFSKR